MIYSLHAHTNLFTITCPNIGIIFPINLLAVILKRTCTTFGRRHWDIECTASYRKLLYKELLPLANTSQRGLEGHTAVLNRLVQLGFEVLLPWGDHLGYDLAYYVTTEEQHFGFFVHRESSLVRIQCKVAWLSNDGNYLNFNTSTVSAGGREIWKKKKSGYEGRAEYFGVYSPNTEKVYMISVSEAPPSSSMQLRLRASKNNQEKNIKWAKNYEL